MIDQYIEEYGRRLFGLCLSLCADRYEAEDLYQETWLKAYKKFDQYDGMRPFEGWLTGICVNTYRDSLRKKKVLKIFESFSSAEEKEMTLDRIPDGESADYSELHEAVSRLPEKLRITVILFYFHDMKLKDVAESLKIPPGTVKSRLNKARAILKEDLANEDIGF